MASIIKRKKNYSVIYSYVDENGENKQKWETYHTHNEALKRKAEIENQQFTGTFLSPSNQIITDFLRDFVHLYGEKKWGVSMYDGQTSIIANYINPIIGNICKKCVHGCKQSFRICLVACPHYSSKRSKIREDKGGKTAK